MRPGGICCSGTVEFSSRGVGKEAVVVLGSSQLKKQGRERMVVLVTMARKTLKWTRVRSYSVERGKWNG